MNIFNLFESFIDRNRYRKAVIAPSHSLVLTYDDLEKQTAQIANYLTGNYVRPQTTICVFSKDAAQIIKLMLASFRMGTRICVLNWRLSASDLSRMISVTEAEILICDDKEVEYANSFLSLSPEAASGVSILPVSVLERASAGCPSSFVNYDASANDDAIILFTSGTTSFPKGVVHTHSSISEYVKMYSKASGWDCDTVYETASPMFHISGFSGMVCILCGGTLVIEDSFNEINFLSNIDSYHVTRVSVSPTTLQRLILCKQFSDFSLVSLKKLVYGGSPISVQLIDRSRSLLNCSLEQGYGMTETGTICILFNEDHSSKTVTDPRKNRRVSVGKPLDGVSIKIINDSKPCTPFHCGEIVIKSPSLFKGYFNYPSNQKTKDSWYYSGDIGYLDDDGYLYVLDRKNDLIISGGENIYPKEIERCIQSLKNDVMQVAVIGIPDEEWGQVPKAFIKKYPGSSVSEQDIIQHCRKNIARYKVPKAIEFLDEMPLSPYGKILKNKLKKMEEEKS